MTAHNPIFSPREIRQRAQRQVHIIELHYLTPRPVDQQIFTESAFLEGWHWIVGRVAARFECDTSDIDCVEADDSGDDFVAVNGVNVARIVHRFEHQDIAARIFAEAAE